MSGGIESKEPGAKPAENWWAKAYSLAEALRQHLAVMPTQADP